MYPAMKESKLVSHQHGIPELSSQVLSCIFIKEGSERDPDVTAENFGNNPVEKIDNEEVQPGKKTGSE